MINNKEKTTLCDKRAETLEAMVAAAFEMAAECCDEADSLELATHGANKIAERIRAITPHDAAAALEARDRRMRNEGRRQAAQVALDWFYDPDRDFVTDDRLAKEILASLEPEDV